MSGTEDVRDWLVNVERGRAERQRKSAFDHPPSVVIARRELIACLRWIAEEKTRGEEIIYRHTFGGSIATDRTPILLAKSRREAAIARDFYRAVVRASDPDKAFKLEMAYRRQQGGALVPTAFLYAP